jgi:hypothetical protein
LVVNFGQKTDKAWAGSQLRDIKRDLAGQVFDIKHTYPRKLQAKVNEISESHDGEDTTKKHGDFTFVEQVNLWVSFLNHPHQYDE